MAQNGIWLNLSCEHHQPCNSSVNAIKVVPRQYFLSDLILFFRGSETVKLTTVGKHPTTVSFISCFHDFMRLKVSPISLILWWDEPELQSICTQYLFWLFTKARWRHLHIYCADKLQWWLFSLAMCVVYPSTDSASVFSFAFRNHGSSNLAMHAMRLVLQFYVRIMLEGLNRKS